MVVKSSVCSKAYGIYMNMEIFIKNWQGNHSPLHFHDTLMCPYGSLLFFIFSLFLKYLLTLDIVNFYT